MAPRDKPLTCAAYHAGRPVKAFVEPFAPGDDLQPMPLILGRDFYIDVPLQESYDAAFAGIASIYKQILTAA